MGFKTTLLSVKIINLTRFETSKTLFSNIFFLDYLTTIFITNINQLHEIGKDLKWRTTYLEAASLPSNFSTRLVDVAPLPVTYTIFLIITSEKISILNYKVKNLN